MAADDISAGATRRFSWPTIVLLLMAVGWAITLVAIYPPSTFNSWDESVYASQFSSTVPAVAASPHRAIGMSLLLAPVTAFTASFVVVRCYLVVVTAVALFLAFRPWIAAHSWTGAAAAGLFAFFTGTLLAAPIAEPNVLTALSAIAAVGYFTRSGGQRPRFGDLVGVAVPLGVMTLLRPTDAAFLAVALGITVIVAKPWRTLGHAAAVVAGMAIGGLTWVIEAFARFGDPLRRFTEMREITDAGGNRPPIILDEVERALATPSRLVLLVLLTLVAVCAMAIGARRARKKGTLGTWVITLAGAAMLGVPYYVLLYWTSTRYLLPAIGLLAIPAAAALTELARLRGTRVRYATATAVVVALLVYGGVEIAKAEPRADASTGERAMRERMAKRLAAHGVQRPCLISGFQAPAFAYALRCQGGDNLNAKSDLRTWTDELRRDEQRAKDENLAFVAILIGDKRPKEVEGWPRIKLNEKPLHYAYFPPGQE